MSESLLPLAKYYKISNKSLLIMAYFRKGGDVCGMNKTKVYFITFSAIRS